MRKFLWLMLILCCSLLFGCANSVSKEQEDSKQVKKYFQGLVKAVDEDDKETFLSYQNEKNSLFYKEQERWIEEVVYKKALGDEITLKINKVTIDKKSSGTIDLSVIMKKETFTKTLDNPITFGIEKVDGKWKINDVPFEKMENDQVLIYYSENQKEIAKTYLHYATSLVRFYESEFEWKHDPITIKLYDTMESLSASVPFPAISGWNEHGESLKIFADPAAILTPNVLIHELTHKLLSDMTNDNAPLFIQEGLATMFESAVSINSENDVSMDLNYTSIMEKRYNDKNFMSFEDIQNLDYHKGIMDIYKYGFLVTNYFVKSKGLDQFFAMCEELKSVPYVDKRTEHKIEDINKNSKDLITRFYGTPDEITKEYTKFYEK